MVNIDLNTKEVNGIKDTSSAISKGDAFNSSDEEKEGDGEIRVGREYQAVPPPFIPNSERNEELGEDKALLVWAPQDSGDDSVLDQFVKTAKGKYGYNIEQALGMLFWHNYDVKQALEDLANYTPFTGNWYMEDMVMFEQAFQYHGKSFQRIRQMLPDKSIADLVKYYYSWKKTRTRTSLMDKKAQQVVKVREEGLYGEECDPEDSAQNGKNIFEGELEEKKEENDARNGAASRSRPKGLKIDMKDITTIATGGGDDMMIKLEEEIINCKRQVQNNKQLISALHRKTKEVDATGLRLEKPEDAVSARWTDQELQLGVHGVRICGKDFHAIADIIGTKTVQHVETFYNTYRLKYDLDTMSTAVEEIGDE